MSQQKLRDASEELRDVLNAVDSDVRQQLQDQAKALADLADQQRGPDHGRVARHQQKLRDIKREAPAAADAIDRANNRINEYRETIEGV